jgi:phosphonopyruvate decarboxylase
MGTITTSMLDLMKIKWEYLSSDMPEALNQIYRANLSIENNQSFFFVVKKGTFSAEKLLDKTPKIVSNVKKSLQVRGDSLPSRLEVLRQLSDLKDPNTVLLATTGKTGRELYEIEDVPNHFYMVGSMGCISHLALGLALTQKHKKVIAIDGDGAVLMRLGSMATNAYYCPTNMLHIVLDNNSYDSTGGQLTVSNNINFIDLAAAVGYTNAYYAHDLIEFAKLVGNWQVHPELTFIYIKIAKGSKENLGRPNVKPYEVKERLMKFILS